MRQTVEVLRLECDLCFNSIDVKRSCSYPEGWVEFYANSSGNDHILICDRCQKDHPKTINLVKALLRCIKNAKPN